MHNASSNARSHSKKRASHTRSHNKAEAFYSISQSKDKTSSMGDFIREGLYLYMKLGHFESAFTLSLLKKGSRGFFKILEIANKLESSENCKYKKAES